MTEAVRTRKGKQTRELILERALELFRERGYEQTTMRAIAERAGVALGSAYYYFGSKEELIQGFYVRQHEEHWEASQAALATERSFHARLLAVMRTKLDTIEPHHRFSGILFRTAADPKSPLNPFSPQSAQARELATRTFAEVVRGSEKLRIPPDLARELPHLLWTYHMGIILFWTHDTSPGRVRTVRLVERTTELVARLVQLAGNPLLAPLRGTTLRLLRELREPAAPAPALEGAVP